MKAVVSLAAAILLCSLPTWGQTPVGGEFQVHSYTTYRQGDSSIAMNGRGDFVVVWESGVNAYTAVYGGLTGPDGNAFGVFGQRYDNIGMPLGGEFQVNVHTTGSQQDPSIASDAEGNFVVVWESRGYYFLGIPDQDGSGTGVFGQRFAADGTPMGPEFQVNTYTTYSQYRPSVAMDADGDFIVVWESYQYGSGGEIFGQRFAADGTPLGPEFEVNTYTTYSQHGSSVAMDADGDFIVVWESYQDGSGEGIFGQRFAADGTRIGAEFQVNTYTTDSQGDPSVSMADDGAFVVVWESEADIFYGGVSQDGDDEGVFAQRYAPNGTPIGGEFQVNTFTTGYQYNPTVRVDADGDFVVVWASGDYFRPQDGSASGIFGQQFRSDGTPRGGEFQINSFSFAGQFEPSAAADADGDFVVVWADYYKEGSGAGLFGQLFTPADAPLGLRTNGDTFSPGDPLNVALNVVNDGVPQSFDIFFGALAPDGNTIFYFADFGATVGIGSLSDLSTLTPFVPNVDFSAPFAFNEPSLLSLNIPVLAPPGPYVIFIAAVVPGAFADGSAGPGDIYALNTVTITITP